MDFDIPQEIQAYLDELDAFIEAEIKPLEQQDDKGWVAKRRMGGSAEGSPTTG